MSDQKAPSDPTKGMLAWKIENFRYLTTVKASPPLTIGSTHANMNKFSLRLYPKDYCKTYPSHVFITIQVDSTTLKLFKFKYSLCLIDSRSKVFLKQEATSLYNGYSEMYSMNFKIDKKLLLDPANDLLIDDVLKIFCELELLDDDDLLTRPNPYSNSQMPIGFGNLLESGNQSDLLIVIGSKEFRVHKLILTAVSPVFAAMFKHDMLESKQNRVEITDIDGNAFEQLLRYIYTGQVEPIRNFEIGLLEASDKYEIKSLKPVCEKTIAKKLTVDNVASVLMMADLHRAKGLKANCLDFITDNADEVRSTDGWKAMVSAKPEWGFMLYERLSDKCSELKRKCNYFASRL